MGRQEEGSEPSQDSFPPVLSWQDSSTHFTDEGAEAQRGGINSLRAGIPNEAGSSRAGGWVPSREQETTKPPSSDAQETCRWDAPGHLSLSTEAQRGIRLKQESEKSVDNSDDSNNL